MATESDLRDLLRDPDPEGRAAIDLDAVLSRARRRRRPKVIVAQALGSVAAVGVLVTGVAVTLPQQTPASVMVADDLAGGAESWSVPGSADESALRMSSALTLNTCGQPVSGLVTVDAPTLHVEPVVAEAGTEHIPVKVTLRGGPNGDASGTTSAPVLTISRDGIVVAQPDAMLAIGYEVAFRASGTFVYETGMLAMQCDPALPADQLAPLPPGEYEVWAAVDFYADDGDDRDVPTLLVGPPSTLVIR